MATNSLSGFAHSIEVAIGKKTGQDELKMLMEALDGKKVSQGH
jgi:hypothetical protein